MARWKNFRTRSRNFYVSGRGRARKFYKSGGGSLIFGIGGAVAGYAAPRVIPYQDTIMTAIAVLPGVLPVGRTIPWQLRRFASGYTLGAIGRNVVPGLIGGSQGGSASDYV